MGTICPSDFKVCIDDICRGSGECMHGKGELLERCHKCREIYSHEYGIYCNCDPEYDEYENDDDRAD